CEITPCPQRNVHRAEVTWADYAIARIAGLILRPACDGELAVDVHSAHRQVVDHTRLFDAGNRFEALEQLTVEGDLARVSAVLRIRQRNLHRQYAFGIEAGVDSHHTP